MPSKSYDEFLDNQLSDPELAAEYLTAAEDGSTEQLLIALRNVAKIHGDRSMAVQLLPIGGKMSELTTPYLDGLHADLHDPAEAVAYLNAALADGDAQVLRLALQDVTEAWKSNQVNQGDPDQTP